MMLPLLDPVENPGTVASDPGTASVLSELWISFASLLRSHLGALQTTGKLAQAVFSHLDVASIQVVDLSRTLRISLQPVTGEGEWSLTRLGEMVGAGVWALSPDAMVSLDGAHALDMELAVEEFARKLWARGLPDATRSNLVRRQG